MPPPCSRAGAAQPTVLQIVERDGDRWLVGPDPRGGPGELQLSLAVLARDIVDQLDRRQAVVLGEADVVTLGPGLDATQGFAARVWPRAGSPVRSPCSTRRSRRLRRGAASRRSPRRSASRSRAPGPDRGRLRTQSEARLSALVQHSTDVILVITPDTIVEYAEPVDSADSRIRRGGLHGPTARRLRRRTGPDALLPALAVLLACASDTSQAFDFRIRHCDGRLLHTECLITNLLENAAVGGIVVDLRDITERKEFEQQLTYQAFHDPSPTSRTGHCSTIASTTR